MKRKSRKIIPKQRMKRHHLPRMATIKMKKLFLSNLKKSLKPLAAEHIYTKGPKRRKVKQLTSE